MKENINEQLKNKEKGGYCMSDVGNWGKLIWIFQSLNAMVLK